MYRVYFVSSGRTRIIQDTPNRSATMPKREEKNVFVNGIWTCPPSARAAKSCSASASVDAVSDRAKPWKAGFPVQRPSETITDVPPRRRLACITLLSEPGGQAPGFGG